MISCGYLEKMGGARRMMLRFVAQESSVLEILSLYCTRLIHTFIIDLGSIFVGILIEGVRT